MAGESTLRLVCLDCLRSVDPGSEPPITDPAATCPFCGGPVEPVIDDRSDDGSQQPPLSLELTPEEEPWRTSDHPPDLDPMALSQIGRFQLRERLGGGGFGEVYRAYDPRLERDVALKVMRETRPSTRLIERFFREARAAARLDHAHLVPLHDAGRSDGRCWIAYEFIAGTTLEQFGKSRVAARDYLTLARLVRDLAEGLDHAHRRGVVHRDVKPSNILIDEEGRPRLTDFGLARWIDQESTLTVEGAVLGTPAYMSPEQAAGTSHRADQRSDVYSLGSVLYELLAGRRPSDVPISVPAWRTAALHPPEPLRQLDPAIPAALDRICQRALAREPRDRYADAHGLAVELTAWIDSVSQARHRRRRLLGLLPILAASWLLAGALGWFLAPAPPSVAVIRPSPPVAALAGESIASSRVPLRLRATGPVLKSQILVEPVPRLFHRVGCPLLQGRAGLRLVPLSSESLARQLGMRPCVRCGAPPPGG